MIKLATALAALAFGFSARAGSDTVAGRKAEPRQRASYMSLESISGESFEEGFLTLRSHPSKMKYSLAYHAPESSKDPIVVLIHGATQEKSSFALVIQSLLEQNPNLGIAAPDLIGAGETLVRNLPVTYDIPIAMNGALVQDVVKTLRAKHPKNPIHVLGLSYGVGAVFEAFKDFPEMSTEVESVIAVSFGDENASASGEVRITGSILKLFWPFNSKRKGADQDFYKAVTSEIIYTRASMLEPTLLRPPFPWTLVALDKLTMGIWGPDFAALEKAVSKNQLHVMLSVEDQFLNVDDLAKKYGKWKSTKSLVMVEESDHKINQSSPNFLASWILQIVNPDPAQVPAGLYVGHPKKGFAENVNDKVKIDLKADEWPRLASSLWAADLVNAWWGWMDPWNYWNMPSYMWGDYFWHTYTQQAEKIGKDIEYTYSLTPEEWLDANIQKWRDAIDPNAKDSISRGFNEISESMARALKKYQDGLKKKPHASSAGKEILCEGSLKASSRQ